MNYDWLYERSGYWTRISIQNDTIEFSLGRNHYSGAILGALVFASFFASMLMIPIGNWFWFCPVLAAILPFTLHSGFKRIRERYSHLPIVLSKHPLGDLANTAIRFENVKELVVRENTGRESDDTALVQLYAILKGVDSPLLLHQHYLFRKQVILETGAEIASKLKTQLVNKL